MAPPNELYDRIDAEESLDDASRVVAVVEKLLRLVEERGS